MTDRRSRHAARIACTAAGITLLLTGCSATPDPTTPSTPRPSASASETASSPASPVPTSTLAADKQQAVDEAAATVLAYEQAFYDILADPTPNLNDINAYSTEPQLTEDLRSLQESSVYVAQGKLAIQSTGPVTLEQVDPIKVDLKANPPTVVLEACIDRTATESTYEGKPREPGRQLTRYRVVKTASRPAPGWAVSLVQPPAGHDQPQPC